MWSYLVHPALKTRYAVAASLLRGEDVIVEVGGYKTPISQFLTHAPKEVAVIDPLLDADADEVTPAGTRVRHIKADFATFDQSRYPADTYSVVFLGMDMHNPEASDADNVQVFAEFLRFASRARSAVIEYPVGWRRAARQFEVVLSVLHPRVEFDCLMDFSQTPIEVPGLSDADRAGRLRRRIVWLKEMARPAADELVGKVARNLYGRAADALAAQAGKRREEVPDGVRWAGLSTHNGTAVRGAGPGARFVTPAQAWSYAVVLPLAAVPAGVLRVEVGVAAGAVAVGFLGANGSDIYHERVVRAGPDQTLDLLVPDRSDLQGLVFRTADQPAPADVTVRSATLYRLV